MGAHRYIFGVIGLMAVAGPLGLGASAVRAMLVPAWRGATARLAEVVLGLTLVVAISESLGTVGAFQVAPVVITSIVVGFGLWGWARRGATPVPTGSWAAGAQAVSVAAALVTCGLVLFQWAGPTLASYDHGIVGLDSLWYHLPWAAWYAQTGHVASLHLTDVEYLSAFYPASGELLHGLGMLLMGSDVLSPAFNLACLALVLLAAWEIGAARGLGAASVTGAAVAMAIPAVFNSQAGSADTDTLSIFCLTAAVALWLRATEPSRAPGDDTHPAEANLAGIAIAGLAAGLGVGVRLNLLEPAAAMTVGVIALAPAGRRRAVAASWLGPLIVAGGFWYLRNLFAAGNPFPWFGIGFLATPHAPLQQSTEFSVWHYLTDVTIWNDLFAPDLGRALGPAWPATLAVALGGAVACLAGGPGRRIRLLGALTLLTALGYLTTPGTAAGLAGHPIGFVFNFRYAAPALTLGLATAPLCRPLRRTVLRWITLAGLAALLVITLLNDSGVPGRYVLGAILVAVGVLMAGTLLALAARHRLAGLGPARTAGLAAVAALALVAAGFGGDRVQRHYLGGRYVRATGLHSINSLYQQTAKLRHVRIAIAGTFLAEFQYPLWGPDHSNDVVYVAVTGPHGSFTPITSCVAWREALNAGHFRYVVTSKAVNPVTRAISPSPEFGWTRGDPGVHLLTRLARRSWVQLFVIRRALDPAGCGGA